MNFTRHLSGLFLPTAMATRLAAATRIAAPRNLSCPPVEARDGSGASPQPYINRRQRRTLFKKLKKKADMTPPRGKRK